MDAIRNPLRYRNFRKIRKDPIKLTALLYLREALLEERYEACAEIIALARQLGADPVEIGNILEDKRRIPNA